MKKQIRNVLILLVLMLMVGPTVSAQSYTWPVAIDEANFPDLAFRTWVLNNVDANANGSLELTEAESITEISFRENSAETFQITSLDGIKYFTNLETLIFATLMPGEVVEARPLPNIAPLSGELNLMHNTKLKWVCISGTQLTSINVNRLTQLTRLQCCDNYALTELVLNRNQELVDLECRYNQLGYLETYQCEKLERFDCRGNCLFYISIWNNPLLKFVDCSENQIESISASYNENLEVLICDDNKIAYAEFECLKLKTLSCERNELCVLDLSYCPNLENLSCANNKLPALDLSNLPKLSSLSCSEQYPMFVPVVAEDNSKQLVAAPVTSYMQSYFDVEGVSNMQFWCDATSTPILSLDMQPVPTMYDASGFVFHEGEKDVDFLTGDAYFTYDYNLKFHPDVDKNQFDSDKIAIKLVPFAPCFAMYVHPASRENNRDDVYVGTLCLPEECAVPDDMRAYYAASIDKASELEGRAYLYELPEDEGYYARFQKTEIGEAMVVTSNTPGYHLFYQAKGYFTPVESGPWMPEPEPVEKGENVLCGTTTGLDVPRLGVLTLGHRTDDGSMIMGFWNYNGTRINKNRAYIPLSAIEEVGMTRAQAKGVSLSYHDVFGNEINPDGTPIDASITGISTATSTVNRTYYDLQGRAVARPQRGGIYITGGRKVLTIEH